MDPFMYICDRWHNIFGISGRNLQSLHVYVTGTVCGSSSTKYTSSSNQMFVKFVSNDDRKTARGFLAQYDAVGTGILNIGKLC